MNNTFRLAFVAASILALTSPILAQTPMKGDRTHTSGRPIPSTKGS